MNELSMKNFSSCERQKKTNVEIILSRSGKKNFIPFLFLFRNLLVAVQLPIHFRLRNYRNCSINRSERERERGTRYTWKFLLFDDWCVPEDISRVWEDQCFMELRNLLADVLPEPFLGLANCSAGVSTFHLVSKFDGYYDGIYKIEIQDLAKKCASVNY